MDQPDSDQPASPAATPRPALLRPRDAATLIILDRSRKKLKLLMGRRHAGLAFMGGKFVFPGGRIEPSDRMMPVAGALSQRADDALRAKLPRAPHHLGRSPRARRDPRDLRGDRPSHRHPRLWSAGDRTAGCVAGLRR
ncbi:protein of unknown function [Methylorubrum extorquens]|uniref:Nudix hydrolase domain-containing protein n=1 Tax=Methylorubrum extorquens TaxID=408 RepID=A0A2N9ARY8_METEX|nr:protein of unknown function [Methylorubrum extorquens]